MELPYHLPERQVARGKRRPLAHASRKTNAAQTGSKGRSNDFS
jgi:hypothetical protein